MRVRDALAAVHQALDHHLTAVEARSGEADPAVFAAYEHLRDAVVAYDDLIYDVHDEVLPVEVVEWGDVDDEELSE